MKYSFLKYAWFSILITFFGGQVRAGHVDGQETKEESAVKYEPISCTLICSTLRTNVWVDVAFSNTTSTVVSVFERNLLKHLPLTWSPFEIFLNGKQVQYIGQEVKRLAPGPADFYRMKPGEVCKAKLDISGYYNLSQPGNYRIRYVSVNPLEGGKKLFFIESPTVNFVKGGQ